MSEIHISIDDVKGIFKALINESFSSVFETRMLSFLREIHKDYGAIFTLYCTYQDAGYSLSKVSDKYRDEFIGNSDWLKFGFHCYDEADDYNNEKENEFRNKFCMFMEELDRVTGQANTPTSLRIHGFSGNEDICRFLKNRGVTVLFSSDDNRQNYYLTNQQNAILNKELHFCDEKTGLLFYKSCTRLEDMDDQNKEIKKYKERNVKYIPIFSHEWLMDSVNVRCKIENICKTEF